MVGPGTGIAPFIGYIEEREYEMAHNSKKIINNQLEEKKFGHMELYYGCRNKAKDFIYQKELTRWKEKGVLSDLFVAFSRDQV